MTILFVANFEVRTWYVALCSNLKPPFLGTVGVTIVLIGSNPPRMNESKYPVHRHHSAKAVVFRGSSKPFRER